MGFHFINVVWGEEYTKVFLNCSLPLQLSPGNLQYFRNSNDSVYKIYTTKYDAETIKSSEIFKVLNETIATQIKVFDLASLMTSDKYGGMNRCHQHAVIEANISNSIMIFLCPDGFFADGTFAKLSELATLGKRAVMVTGHRTTKETILPTLKKHPNFNHLCAIISPREMVKMALDNLHPWSQAAFWDSPNFNSNPSHIYWKVGDEGLLARCFHLHPLMINPVRKDIVPLATIDIEYLSQVISSFQDIYIVEDSDDIFCCSVSSAEDDLIQPNIKAQVNEVRHWAEQCAVLHHWWSFFYHKIRIHTGDVSKNWKVVESESDEIANQIVNESDFKKRVFYEMLQKGYQLAGQGLIKECCNSFQAALDAQRDLANIHQFNQLGIRILAQSFTGDIGHTALYIDLYVKIDKLGWGEPERPILLAYPEKTANLCYAHYWGRYMPVISDPQLVSSLSFLTESFEEISGILVRCKEQYMWWSEAIALVEKQWNAEGRAPLLSLSTSDADRGWHCLEKLGIPKDAWFVCIHAREPGYAKQRQGASYQNHRNNVDIDTYLLAIKTIVARGGWVIRMGDPSMKPLPTLPGVIDYAHSKFKSDWMDVFLCAQCRFFLGDTSGICLVSYTFGVPCALTNVVPIANRAFSTKDISIPKLMWSVKEDQYLSFAEALEPPFAQHYEEDFLHKHELRLVDNTAEEVEALMVEMLERLEGTVEYTAKDERLQEQYNFLGANTYGNFGINSRIGRDFLRKYAKLLPM